MMRARSRPRCVAIASLLLCLGSSIAVAPAFAHKFGGPNDPCERKIGSSLIHITLYQPEFDPDAEYCDAIPREGNTVLVVDTMGDELRRVPIGVQVFAVGKDGARELVLAIPPAVYRRGVVDTQVNLAEGRRYIATVSIGSENGPGTTTYSFHILVRAWYRALVMPALMVLGVLALVAISVIRYLRSQGPSERRFRRSAAAALIVSAMIVAGSIASGCHSSPTATRALPDVQLIDDYGKPVALGSLKGKVVLIDFVHIGCPGVCDTLINKFGQIADQIRPELGTRVILVSVTNNPVQDRPELLLKLARDRQADMSGWLFLTGNAAVVNRVIAAFGIDNHLLPDGSPQHISRVFMLGPDLRQQREYAGMAMNARAVASQIMSEVSRGGAQVVSRDAIRKE
jgi:cytochrome oxidase Cu insertion factor (SCO1/SenC/PrrC family)